MKKSEILKKKHQVQLKWIDNQIIKIANEGALSFSNPDVAERAYKEMNNTLIVSDSDIEHFISVHLSEIGIKKLVTTLRVHVSRNNAERLQVEITKENKKKLDKLVNISGKTKIQIINQLIANSKIGDFQRAEEQLEIVTV